MQGRLRRPGGASLPVLPVLMFAAWTLAAAHGLIRPLFQVSDELSYIHTVQARALQFSGSADRACIAPPEGTTLDFPLGGGKFGFHAAAGGVLLAACRAGFGSASLTVTRVVLALSLPLLVVATWLMGRLIAPGSTFVPAAAAMMTAFQPVLATFSGGVTPDGPANAASAFALLAACHLLFAAGEARWAAVHVVAVVVAIASKDSALFLAPLALVVLLIWVMRRGGRAVVIVAGLTASVVALMWRYDLWSRLATPFPNLDRVLLQAWTAPREFGGTVVQALVGNAWLITWTGLGELANFGGGVLPLPTSFFLVQVLTLALGAVGLLFRASRPDTAAPRLLAFVVFAAGAVLLEAAQVPVRQLMTNSLGPIQGRWLFPVWPLLAVLAALGLDWSLGRRAVRTLPALTLLWAATSLAALVRVVGYYYVSWPRAYDWTHVFMRAGEGYEAGSDTVRAMIAAAAAPAMARQVAIVASIGISILAVVLVTRAVGLSPAPPREPHHG